MHTLLKIRFGAFMESCTNLYLLASVACQLAECLDQKQLEILAADLVVLSDMLANLALKKVE